MRTTIDTAGRVVIPKALRDALGLHAGPIDLIADGNALRIEPVIGADLSRSPEGRLVIPASGGLVDDDLVSALRLADQR